MKKTTAAKNYAKEHKAALKDIQKLMKDQGLHLTHDESVFDPTPCKMPRLKRYTGHLGKGYAVHDEMRYNGTKNYKVIRYYVEKPEEPKTPEKRKEKKK